MSKIRNLPEITTLADEDMFYVVDDSAGSNGGRKIRKANLKATAENHHISHRAGGSDGLDVAAPVSVNADGNNDEGTAFSFSRSDHKHNISVGIPVTQNPDQVNAAGSSSSVARADHIHNIPADAPTTTLSPVTSNDEGVGMSFSRNDHTHQIATGLVGDISSIAPDDGPSAGSVDKFARADHKHAISTDTAQTLTPDGGNSEGVSTSFARADHLHNVPAAAPTTTLSPATSNAEGVGSSFSRNDHTHAINTGLTADISTIQPDDAAAAGSLDKFARADHKHAIAAAAASGQTPDQSNAEGVSTSFARADHVHNIPTAAPSNTGTANAQGSASSFARSDHVHNTVISYLTASQTTADTTTSTTDTLIVGMTLTPAAGTWNVNFRASTLNSGNGTERNYISVYVGGVQVAGSEIRVGIGGGAVASIATGAIVTVNGSQAVEIRWRVIAGTGTVYQRAMNATRLA